MTKIKKDKLTIIFAAVSLMLGFALTFISIFFPPKGAIDASIITLMGLIFAFVGALLGIDYKGAATMREIDYKYRQRTEEEDESNE